MSQRSRQGPLGPGISKDSVHGYKGCKMNGSAVKSHLLRYCKKIRRGRHRNAASTNSAADHQVADSKLWRESANKSNPDPNQWVGSGDRTVDEMAHAWVNVTYMPEEDFKAEVEKRKASTSVKTTDSQRQP